MQAHPIHMKRTNAAANCIADSSSATINATTDLIEEPLKAALTGPPLEPLAESLEEFQIASGVIEAINDITAKEPAENDLEKIESEGVDLEAIDLTLPAAEKSRNKPKVSRIGTIPSYFSEMAKIPVQSREEEAALGVKIMDERKRFALIRHERKHLKSRLEKKLPEEKRSSLLARKKILDEKYRAEKLKVRTLENELIRHNLRLVVRFARNIHVKGINFMDLIQEGNDGMRRASRKFDPAKGYRFSTYASFWIRQSINRYVKNKGTTIRLPVHVWDKRSKCHKAVEILRSQHNSELNYQPGKEEIAEVVGTTSEQVRKLESLPQVTHSLDMPVKAGEDICLIDIVPDEKTPATDEDLSRKSENGYLDGLLMELTPRELLIIKRRFGLDAGSSKDADGMTLNEIGKMMNLTRERIRQLQDQALGKMRRAALKKKE